MFNTIKAIDVIKVWISYAYAYSNNKQLYRRRLLLSIHIFFIRIKLRRMSFILIYIVGNVIVRLINIVLPGIVMDLSAHQYFTPLHPIVQ